jgi:imidazoleglycerol phosphate dehydratase HisB
MARNAKIVRKTTETDIVLEIDLDKSAGSKIATTIPFFDHMLELFARHGFFKLVVKSKGDTQIDDHHLVEDLGICLGQSVGQALGKKIGINRYGFGPSLSDLQS